MEDDEPAYTEADRQADSWRSLKATIATVCVLAVSFLVFLGLAGLISRH